MREIAFNRSMKGTFFSIRRLLVLEQSMNLCYTLLNPREPTGSIFIGVISMRVRAIFQKLVYALLVGVVAEYPGAYAQQQVRLTAGDLAAFPQAGKPIAISGNRVVVGALAGSPDETGAAYVFEQDDAGHWTRSAKLLPTGAAPGERFAVCVAIS